MIRLLHLLPLLGVGGTETMVLNLCRYRDAREFSCAVASVGEHPEVIADEIRALGVPVHLGEEACRAVLEWADLVNLHWYRYSPSLLSLVQEAGKPFVTTLHTAIVLPPVPALTICTSEKTGKIQPDRRRFVAIPNGVDVTRFTPRERPVGPEVNLVRVCRPPRCAPYFWHVICEVLARYPQARLRIVGNPKLCHHPSGRVDFLGVRRDVPEILAAADIFVYTPYPELGSKDLVVMEASAAGLPSVVSDVGSVQESVENGKTGFRVPFGDIPGMVEKLGRLIEDPALCREMGRAAAERARAEFDIRETARRYELAYREVLAASRRTNPSVAPPPSRGPQAFAAPEAPAGQNRREGWGAFAARWWPEGLLRGPDPTDRRVRCAIFSPCLKLGGAERWILDLLSSTSAREVEWIGVGQAFPEQQDPAIADQVRQICPIFPGRRAVAGLARSADVLLAWGLPGWWQWVPDDARCRKVFVSHGVGDWTRQALGDSGRADFLAPVSRAAASSVPEEERPRVRVIYNGVDARRIAPRRDPAGLRAEWGIPPERRVLGYLGRLSSEKNPQAVVEAVASLPEDWCGVLVGWGAESGPLRNRGSIRCPGRICLPGPSLDVGSVLAAFDVLLCPSYEEGFCYALVEGWLARRPTVSSPTGIALEHPDLVRAIPMAASGAQIAAAVLAEAAGEGRDRIEAAFQVASTEFTLAAFGERWTRLLTEAGAARREDAGAPVVAAT